MKFWNNEAHLKMDVFELSSDASLRTGHLWNAPLILFLTSLVGWLEYNFIASDLEQESSNFSTDTYMEPHLDSH